MFSGYGFRTVVAVCDVRAGDEAGRGVGETDDRVVLC